MSIFAWENWKLCVVSFSKLRFTIFWILRVHFSTPLSEVYLRGTLQDVIIPIACHKGTFYVLEFLVEGVATGAK